MAVSADEFFAALALLISGRRAALRRPVTACFVVVDAGMFSVDTRSREIVRRGHDASADLSIVCNERTLSDLLLGEFDPRDPKEHQLFVWTGNAEALAGLGHALSGAHTLLATRAGVGV